MLLTQRDPEGSTLTSTMLLRTYYSAHSLKQKRTNLLFCIRWTLLVRITMYCSKKILRLVGFPTKCSMPWYLNHNKLCFWEHVLIRRFYARLSYPMLINMLKLKIIMCEGLTLYVFSYVNVIQDLLIIFANFVMSQAV